MAVHGLLGYFNPALPYSADELRGMGFDTQDGRYTTPAPDEHMLGELFGDLAGEVRATCMKEGRLLPAYATQRKVAARFPGDDERQDPAPGKGSWHCSTTCSSSKTRAARAISTPASPPTRRTPTAGSTESAVQLSTGSIPTSSTTGTTVSGRNPPCASSRCSSRRPRC